MLKGRMLSDDMAFAGKLRMSAFCGSLKEKNGGLPEMADEKSRHGCVPARGRSTDIKFETNK